VERAAAARVHLDRGPVPAEAVPVGPERRRLGRGEEVTGRHGQKVERFDGRARRSRDDPPRAVRQGLCPYQPGDAIEQGLALTPGFDRVACVQLVLAEQDPVDL